MKAELTAAKGPCSTWEPHPQGLCRSFWNIRWWRSLWAHRGQGRGVSSLCPQIQFCVPVGRLPPLPPPLHPAGSRLCFSLRGSRLQEAETSMWASSPSPLASLWVRPLSNTEWGVGVSTPVSLPSGSLVSLTEGQGLSQRQAALSISPLPLPSAPCSSLPESPCLCPALSPSPSPFSSESGSHPAFPYISQQQEVVLAPWGWKPQGAALPLKASLFPVFLHLVSIPFIQDPLASPRSTPSCQDPRDTKLWVR